MELEIDLKYSLKLILTQQMKLSLSILQMGYYGLKEYLENENDSSQVEIIYTKKSNIKEYNLDEDRNSNNNLLIFLEEQIGYLNISPMMKNILHYLINNLDERGYLKISETEIIGYKSEIYNNAVKILKTLEPSGIGAFNLKECLKIQLQQQNRLDKNLIDIIDFNLKEIALNNIKKISKDRNLSDKSIENYIKIIKNLNPKPARGYYINSKISYIIPDIIVKIEKNIIEIELNKDATPKIYIKQMDTKNCLKYSMIEKAIKKRGETILKVSRYIFEYHKKSILLGENLKTLKIKEIANHLQIHSSTVSRAIKDKYVRINNTNVLLKKYIVLNEKVNSIKNNIYDIINSENKNNPFSDSAILIQLLKTGFNLNRRTVSKYRKEMGILASKKRKEAIK